MKRILMAAAVCVLYTLGCAGCGAKKNANSDMSDSELQAKQAEAKSRMEQSDAARAGSMKGGGGNYQRGK